MADIILAGGMRFEKPSDATKEKAPWVKGKLSFKVDEAIEFLQKYKSETGWVNCDLKLSEKTGKLYLALNTFKVGANTFKKAEEIDPNSINF